MNRFHLSPILPLAMLALAVSVLTAAAPAAAATTTYTITDLGSLGYGVSDGYAVNATGQVTGASYTGATLPAPGCCGNCYTNHKKPCVAHIYHAFLWSNGTMTDLGGNYSQANAINASGQVAGWANTKTGSHDAALWNGKTVTDLGALGPMAGWESTAYGINDSGQVVGSWGNNPSS
jgi:probable HAF family extracellular repeat protein